jgi:hypothetical protein
MDDKKKKQKSMAAWTLAIFGTILAVSFAVLWLISSGLYNSKGAILGHVFAMGWPILLIDVVLCAGVYFGYGWFINRKK